MITGVIINDVNTAEDLELYLLDDLVIPEPEAKTQYVDIPGASGSLDYTEALTGYPTYKNREITFSLFDRMDTEEMDLKRGYLFRHFHGRICDVETPDKPGWHWRGRLGVGTTGAYREGKIPISVTAYPYRYKDEETVRTFNLAANTPVTFVLESAGMPTMPRFLTSGAVTLTDADGNTYAVRSGSEVEFAALMLTELRTTLTVEADRACTFKVTYQEGAL